MTSSLGVIGLGSIGKNLALNIQEKQKLHVYNKTHSKVIALEEQSENVFGHVRDDENASCTSDRSDTS